MHVIITGTMISIQYGRSLDEMGSKRQVDLGELLIKFLISSVVTDSNEEKTVATMQSNYIIGNLHKI